VNPKCTIEMIRGNAAPSARPSRMRMGTALAVGACAALLWTGIYFSTPASAEVAAVAARWARRPWRAAPVRRRGGAPGDSSRSCKRFPVPTSRFR